MDALCAHGETLFPIQPTTGRIISIDIYNSKIEPEYSHLNLY